MPQLKILISGAGIAGTSLAFWLTKLGHSVTVAERHPALRTDGLQIDLRGPGVRVLRRMGASLEAGFRARAAPEQGAQVVDGSGRRRGFFPVNDTGKGLQSFTTEYEIMRGDFCRLLYDESKDVAEYRFGTHIESFEQDGDGVAVRFSGAAAGTAERFDLLIGADGVMSRTRRMMLGPDAKDAFKPLKGLVSGYFTIDRPMKKDEEYIATMYVGTNRRAVMTRRANPHKLQVYIGGQIDPKRLDEVARGDVQQEKDMLADFLRGAGWETPEYVEAMRASDNFYCERLGIVRLDDWSRGRVVLAGDAAHCPSATTGMGTTSAVVGAYILAGELSRAFAGKDDGSSESRGDDDKISAAFRSYQEKFQPFMQQVMRDLDEGSDPYKMVPTSAIGIGILNLIIGLVSFLRLHVLVSSLLREKVDDWQLPAYKELDVKDE
ncbi:hypothetical protein N3K66_007227 [Trichothecium roseum]|uniref:Uncharacterized protein n=1 Tax=Trichothecium roseum TaxID=47278 RepID=A0ACC0UTE1_9HYPO|nr:hypothetical protein N3K66_007227 [Trichothecium roseum]